MKKQDITYQDKLNELRLDISHPNSNGLAFILVEGDTDIRLYRKLFDLKSCKVEGIPGGKSKLEEGVSELLNISKLIIGIRDADFLHLSVVPYANPNIFLTDFHDMEMGLVFEDEVFGRILFEFTDIPREEHSVTRKAIIDTIEEISFIKWLNEIENLNIKFDETAFRDIISFANSTIDIKEYFSRLLSKSPNSKISDIQLVKSKIKDLKAKNPDVFQLCNGHDFIQAFSQFLREKGKVRGVSDNLIASVFRINFNKDLFIKTNLYHTTKKWADDNNCSVHI